MAPETWLQKLLMQSPRFGSWWKIDSLLWIWSLADWQVLTWLVLPFFHDHFHFSTELSDVQDLKRASMRNTEEFLLQDSPLLMLPQPNRFSTVKAKDDHTCELGQFMNKTFETLHAKFAFCLPWMKIFLSFYDYLSKQFRHAQVKIDHNWVFVEKHIRSHGKTRCFCSEIAKLWLQACYMCCMHNYAWQVVLDDWPFFLKTFSLSWCKQLFLIDFLQGLDCLLIIFLPSWGLWT